mgnify:CR=1 FL=1
MIKPQRNWTNKEIQEAIELRRDCTPIKGISYLLNRTFWSVAKKLKEKNIRHPYRRKRHRVIYERSKI